MYKNSPQKFGRKTQCWIFHGRPVLLCYVFRETLTKCRKWHILLNLATRHSSTLGEDHLGQRWRIWDPIGTHNNVFRKKSTSLNPMTLIDSSKPVFERSTEYEYWPNHLLVSGLERQVLLTAGDLSGRNKGECVPLLAVRTHYCQRGKPASNVCSV